MHIVFALASLSAAPSRVHADVVEQREDQFKAAYVFNFLKFVEWPAAAASDTLTICFAGGAGVHHALMAGIENKRAGTRRVAALLLSVDTPPKHCDALYLDAAAAATYTPDAASHTLTISDSRGFIDQGGMIELFIENHRLRFMVGLGSAEGAGLRISSDLLKLAADVRREAR
jgi:hypothetical protein